jgi:hypothetical protein
MNTAFKRKMIKQLEKNKEKAMANISTFLKDLPLLHNVKVVEFDYPEESNYSNKKNFQKK